ncbi:MULTISPECIES: hypothetical protein [Xanthomonas]|uniref:Uncharacterized protein n=2 Tax=Xanthomonas TaxID=338 RepID=A0A6N7QBG2_9XANT|nr:MULTISPECIES: hypothetical protein [Xanthomonas]MCW0378974.1 hypothetical protein [Xanthomonas sacchari]MRH01190.1 hypothetical protein [Xanthomonas sontii]MRH75373.1 hypothetical protein [Xanthomonas sontii]
MLYSNEALFVWLYAAAALVLSLVNRHDFKRSPKKAARYKKLPTRYKFGCWFVVLPLFAGTIFMGWLLIPAIIGYALLEAACVRWYRRAELI